MEPGHARAETRRHAGGGDRAIPHLALRRPAARRRGQGRAARAGPVLLVRTAALPWRRAARGGDWLIAPSGHSHRSERAPRARTREARLLFGADTPTRARS